MADQPSTSDGDGFWSNLVQAFSPTVPMAPLTRGAPDQFSHDFTLDPATGGMKNDTALSPADISSGNYARLPLSNGQFFNYDPKTLKTEDATAHQQALQSMLDNHYKGLAQQAPSGIYETPTMIYSETNAYPNTAVGRSMARLDVGGRGGPDVATFPWGQMKVSDQPSPGVGNLIAKEFTDPLNKTPIPGSTALTPGGIPFRTAGEVGMRAAPYALGGIPVGAYDLAAGALNAAKHGITASTGAGQNLPDIPTVSGAWRSETGTPDMPANAGITQQLIEAGLGGLRPGSGVAGSVANLIRAAPSTAASWLAGNVGGDVAAKLFGEQWRELGQTGGSYAGGVAPSVARLGTQRSFGGAISQPPATEAGQVPGAADIRTAGQALAQDYAARTGEAPPNWPSTEAMISPGWRRSLSWLAAQPVWGGRLTADVDEQGRAVLQAKNATSQQLSPGFQPGTGSIENIGELAQVAARNAIPRLLQQRDQLYLDLANRYGVGNNDEVSAAPFMQSVRQALYGQQIPGDWANNLLDIAHRNVMSATQGGANFRPEERPNAEVPLNGVGPVANPTVPYRLLQRVLSMQNNAMGGNAATIDQAVPMMVKDAALEALGSHYGQFGPQAQADFNTARANYKHYEQNVLPQFYKVAGDPVTDGQGNIVDWRNPTPAGFGQIAGNLLTSQKQSPNIYAPFAAHVGQTPEGRQLLGAISANVVDMLGQPAGAAAATRPEKFAADFRKWGDTMATLTGGQQQPSGTLSAYDRLRHAQTLGETFSLDPARTGLQKTAGASVAMRDILDLIGRQKPLGIDMGPLLQGGVISALGSGMTSPSFKRAIAGAPYGADLARALYQNTPQAAAAASQYQTGGRF